MSCGLSLIVLAVRKLNSACATGFASAELIAADDSESTTSAGKASGTLSHLVNYGRKPSAKAFGLSRSPVANSVSSFHVRHKEQKGNAVAT